MIGPIETYEDLIFGSEAANEAYVLIKDGEWSRRLERYASLLPALQRGLPEEKADVLGLYMVTQLTGMGELPREELFDSYLTFLAGLFRSVRFGATSAHGQADMATFNFFQGRGAFTRDAATGRCRVHFEAMRQAVGALSERILRLQGTGDYAGVGEFMGSNGVIRPQLRGDLNRLSRRGIPVDIVFEQGPSVLGIGQ